MIDNRRRILCVDDNEDNSSMLTVLLGLSSYEAVAANSVEEALQLARKESFDLYILDNRFPDGTGTGLCREIRQLHPHTPVIFYSGDDFLSDDTKSHQSSAQDYVVKPDIDKLLNTVNQFLAA
ncbi:MAG: response regulator [Acidobacteria bacterium]|nr:response regulator [Acidobacteriota bacterium]